jgi:putative endonuclease
MNSTNSGKINKLYWLYFILCQGDGVYIGVTKDVSKRYSQHLTGKGALYTKTHPPIKLLFSLPIGTRAEAMRQEKSLKKMRADKKLEWAEDHGWQPEYESSC